MIFFISMKPAVDGHVSCVGHGSTTHKGLSVILYSFYVLWPESDVDGTFLSLHRAPQCPTMGQVSIVAEKMFLSKLVNTAASGPCG